jgi:hypothetical protein
MNEPDEPGPKTNQHPDSEGADLDAFTLGDIFPEAEALFQFQRVELEAALKTAFFVLDTNALLKPYQFNQVAIDGLGGLYRDLIEGGRLVVPAHAAREFAHRRPDKIKDLYQAVSAARKATLRTTLAAFGRFSQSEEIAKLEADIAKQIDERDRLLQEVLTTIRSWQGDDPVSVLYRELFTSGVVVSPDEDEETLKRDAGQRFRHRIPPGYKDRSKPTNAAGDVLIWHSILAAGRKQKRHAIFVSGEQKADWFHRSNREALFPRVELIDEYRRASSGRSIHIISFEQFLRRLNADVEVIRQVHVADAAARPKGHWGFYAERAVIRWIRDTIGFDTISESNGFPDFYGLANEDAIAVEVKLASDRPLWVTKARNVLARAGREEVGTDLVLVFVALSETNGTNALRALKFAFGRKPDDLGTTLIFVGYLNNEGELAVQGEVLDRPMKGPRSD